MQPYTFHPYARYETEYALLACMKEKVILHNAVF